MFENMKMNKAKKLLKKRIIIMLDKGTAKEEIIKKAEKVGWKKENIEEIFKQLEKKKKEEKEIKIKVPFLKKKKQEEIKEESEEPKKKGFAGQLKDIKETLDIISDKKKQEKKLKKKKFKLPFKVKSQLKKLAVKGKVQVMLLQRTRNIKPVIGEVRDGMLLIGKDMVYNGSVDATWLWEGKIPTMIVPEWDLQPMTPNGIEEMKRTSTMSAEELMNYCIKFGRSAVPGKIIIRAIEAKQNQMLNATGNIKGVILAIVGTLIVAAILFGGGFV
ncbi:hypothetical protein LCGC14_1028980 [marine sediment metagenome]|uniref:Uncharacterized protein n=1 Tax=marine sediment metagenome TaxID=412755 RepID=A0A0F9MZP8_9ZZZZ